LERGKVVFWCCIKAYFDLSFELPEGEAYLLVNLKNTPLEKGST
jgi:hypothetical protein